jgi:acyl dehydratase
MVVGTELEPKVFPAITRTRIVEYQGASGDFQPIHHDEPFARSAGYDAPLVVGMLPAGMLTAWAAERFGAANVRRARVRFRSMVWPGDVLTAQGRVVGHDDEKIELELWATNGADVVVVQAWMTFVNREGPP